MESISGECGTAWNQCYTDNKIRLNQIRLDKIR